MKIKYFIFIIKKFFLRILKVAMEYSYIIPKVSKIIISMINKENNIGISTKFKKNNPLEV